MNASAIAIASHGRADRIESWTLGFLDRMGIERRHVTIFVAEDQLEDYRQLDGVNVKPGRLGLAANRNHLVSYFPKGTRVLSLDDDLLGVLIRDADNLKAITPDEFRSMVREGFGLLEPWRAAMWGISPVHNDRWRGPALQVGAPGVEGPLFGFVSGRGDLTVPLETRYEDTERVCRLFEAGWNVARLNDYVHEQSTASAGGRADRNGGCGDVRRLERDYPALVEHRFGKLASADPCRPAIRARRWVDNPESLPEVDDMRERIAAERLPPVATEVHEWAMVGPERPADARAQRIEDAIVELRIALDAYPAYGRGDPAVDAIRSATQKHYTERKPKRALTSMEEM